MSDSKYPPASAVSSHRPSSASSQEDTRFNALRSRFTNSTDPPPLATSFLEDEIGQASVANSAFKNPPTSHPQVIQLDPHTPEFSLSSRSRGKYRSAPVRASMSSSRFLRNSRSPTEGPSSDFGELTIPDHPFNYHESAPSPFPSTSSNSPQYDSGRLSPLDAAELEEARTRSRKNEANSRVRMQEAEQRLRTAIYERGKQIPSSKHRVNSMAADIISDDIQELHRLSKRVRELEISHQQLQQENQNLRARNRNLEEGYLNLQAQLQSVHLPATWVPESTVGMVPTQWSAPGTQIRDPNIHVHHSMPNWQSGC